ncbi:hypothetical protein EDB80DRAFT_688801 [Ilyonectria destructans]|nr:hypothetical protein EDB80DRAFT_688801 [Ilyonectria destructans]
MAVDLMKVSQGGREPGQLFNGPHENGQRSVRCRLVFPKLLQVPVINPWEDDARDLITSGQVFDDVIVVDGIDLAQIVPLMCVIFEGVEEFLDSNETGSPPFSLERALGSVKRPAGTWAKTYLRGDLCKENTAELRVSLVLTCGELQGAFLVKFNFNRMAVFEVQYGCLSSPLFLQERTYRSLFPGWESDSLVLVTVLQNITLGAKGRSSSVSASAVRLLREFSLSWPMMARTATSFLACRSLLSKPRLRNSKRIQFHLERSADLTLVNVTISNNFCSGIYSLFVTMQI